MSSYFVDLLASKSIDHLFYSKNNSGFATGLNYLITLFIETDCKYFVRMDSDDICDVNRFKLQKEFLDSNDDIDVLGTGIFEFREDGTGTVVKYPINHSEILSRFKFMAPIPHVSAVMRKEFFRDNLKYDTAVGLDEDLKLWLDAFKLGRKFACLNFPLVNVRINNNFLQRRRNFNYLFKTYKIKNKIIKELNFPRKYLLLNFIYLLVKLLPVRILNLIYKIR